MDTRYVSNIKSSYFREIRNLENFMNLIESGMTQKILPSHHENIPI